MHSQHPLWNQRKLDAPIDWQFVLHLLQLMHSNTNATVQLSVVLLDLNGGVNSVLSATINTVHKKQMLQTNGTSSHFLQTVQLKHKEGTRKNPQQSSRWRGPWLQITKHNNFEHSLNSYSISFFEEGVVMSTSIWNVILVHRSFGSEYSVKTWNSSGIFSSKFSM